MTTEEFIIKARKVHGDKYVYSKVKYVRSSEKVCIICPEHGKFWQRANAHLSGGGCNACSGNKRIDKDEFIERARKVHGDKYDYSKVNYINFYTKVCIICPEHGEFWQTPKEHLRRNCPKCAHQSYLDTKETFIEKSRKVHGDKYDYSKVNYINSHTKVCVICPEHGEFWMAPTNHLRGKGCKICSYIEASIRNRLTVGEFIEKAKKVHGDKYDYSKVEYINLETKVCIICPTHGEFWQTPSAHLAGSGCRRCNESKIEREIRIYLTNLNIKLEEFKKFKWLNRQHLDFYLPEYNIAIECQGEQHFNEIKKFKKPLSNTIEMDRKKNLLCKKNGVKLLYFASKTTYNNILQMPDFYDKIFTDKEELIQKIKGD